MGRDSQFYKEKQKNQKIKLRELMDQLPEFAKDFIYSKELTTQTSTLISYSYDLLTFFRFLQEKNPSMSHMAIKDIPLSCLNHLTPEDIVEYQRFLELNLEGEFHENGKKSIAKKLSPLRGLFQYHYERKNIIDNPMVLVKLPKLKKDKNIIRMTNDEVQAILFAIENNAGLAMSERQRKYLAKTPKRDLAILTLMLGTGIRVSECNGLDLTDIDFRENSMTIIRKGGGQDVLYFGEEIHDVLKDYIESERAFITPQDEKNEPALFYSTQGRRLSVDSIENLVKKYAKMVVPNKKITPHKLRSTYGTALYRETGDIRLVADVLGHENINTTIDYYAAMEDEHKRQAAGAVNYRKNKIQ